MRIRIKICGITRVQDGLDAAYLGADAIGLVFYQHSPRAVTIAQARLIMQALPPFVTTVGLFVDAPTEEVQNILTQLPLDILQFHGNETPSYCQQFARPYIKALRVQPETDIVAFIEQYQQAQAILLDSYVKGIKGGTGIKFDWQLIPTNSNLPLIIAGGLNPDNVAQIAIMQPYALDVSGGVEIAPGIKDKTKIATFMQRIKI
jgi:phosphoribosylanthranilate isomerase